MNVLKEKGMPLDKQLRNWHKIVGEPYNKTDIDCYTRTRQILMNGIEIEAWGFKHQLLRFLSNLDIEDRNLISKISRIENTQQITNNWMGPADQSVLETTLAYEQVAVDLTAWLAQNESDKYVKETFDFGLLEDFDHLYRYSQFAYMTEGIEPSVIVQGQTDVIVGRPTQHHHNCNSLRLRKHYDKDKATPQTKVNILTVLSGEQQTHNFYAEHGFMYGDHILRETYAEIKDVEEEHVTMYESLIDPNESMFEKFLLHEFTEVCNYYTCYEDEVDDEIKKVWEMFNEILNRSHSLRNVVVLTGYELSLSARLKRGSDIWLNTPLRPFEASGTSGMSANMNGALHLSIFDGWTVEGTFDGINGYTVEYEGLDDEMSWEERHWKDHECIMDKIENQIIPTYYDNKQEWARLMRQAIRTSEAYFNSDRMVIEYYNRLYNPIAHSGESAGGEKRQMNISEKPTFDAWTFSNIK